MCEEDDDDCDLELNGSISSKDETMKRSTFR